MIEMYGGKRIISATEQYEGLVIEFCDNKLVAREYGKNENDVYIQNDNYQQIDYTQLVDRRTEFSKIRDISKQLGTGNYVISEDAVKIISVL